MSNTLFLNRFINMSSTNTAKNTVKFLVSDPRAGVVQAQRSGPAVNWYYRNAPLSLGTFELFMNVLGL